MTQNYSLIKIQFMNDLKNYFKKFTESYTNGEKTNISNKSSEPTWNSKNDRKLSYNNNNKINITAFGVLRHGLLSFKFI